MWLANKRISIPKKTRFEVFKRDNFTCQYCGRKSPEVVLEIDHINPVSKGGTNNIMNLVTSCFDCNRGKGKTTLKDSSEITIQRKQLELLNKRREQIEMIAMWREELLSIQKKEVDYIDDYFMSVTGYHLSKHGRKTCSDRIKKYGFQEVFDCLIYSIDKYYDGNSTRSAITAWDKTGGVCYNRWRQRIGNVK